VLFSFYVHICDIHLLHRFGVIWEYTKLKHINTPQEYEKVLRDAFPNSNVDVKDIFCVPDYKRFFRPVIDKKLAHYTKLEETKLQWHFEKTADPNFPCGVSYDSVAPELPFDSLS